MKLTIVALLVAVAAALVGCGSAAPDAFVGTWQAISAPTGRLVIVKSDGNYASYLDSGAKNGGITIGPVPLKKQGNALVFLPTNGLSGYSYVYNASTHRLQYKTADASGGPIFKKVGNSTAHPSPASHASPSTSP